MVRSVRRGEHVVVAGRLRIRDWHNADKNGTAIEIEADSVGHDLTWCTTISQRVAPAPGRPSDEHEDVTDRADPDGPAALDLAESDGFPPREGVGLVAVDS